MTKKAKSKIAIFENKEIRKDLFLLFSKNAKQENNNQNYSSKNIKINHKIIDIHNYSLINNKLPNQAKTENTNPVVKLDQFTSLENNGPIKAEAKNICPISEEMSESLETRESDKKDVNFIQNNDTPREYVLSRNILRNIVTKIGFAILSQKRIF